MDLGIRGKHALVTGGSHGIGRSIAQALAREGCHVAICARGQERIDRVVAQIRESTNVEAFGIAADATKPKDIQTVIRAAVHRWKTLHILVNNVGGGGRWGNECVEDTPETVWLEVFQKNAMAAVRFTVAVLPWMRKQKWGRVLTITSIYGREGGGRPWFNMAKAAQTSLMKTLAMKPELARDGITFNSLAPGPIMIPDTGWDEQRKLAPDRFRDDVERRLVLGRLGTSEEVANVAVFLCSEKASLVNGASLVVDGGESRAF